jgi:hypothetical protein
VSALLSAQEGRGFNAYLPIPFRRRIKIEVTNASPRPTVLYYQLDYTLERNLAPETGLLHVSFRRENPTRLKRDFTIAEGLRGPGRFLGCSVGVRTLPQKNFAWYGEGELKIFRTATARSPPSAAPGRGRVGNGLGAGLHFALYGGVPPDLRGPESADPRLRQLLPLARRGPGGVRARAARDDPADGYAAVPGRGAGPGRCRARTPPPGRAGSDNSPRCARDRRAGDDYQVRTAATRSRCRGSTRRSRARTSSAGPTSRRSPWRSSWER